MKIIVGLGNPGLSYRKTRHNVGFMLLDVLRSSFGDDSRPFDFEKKFEAEISHVIDEDEKIILIKPQTFMNKSGEAVYRLVSFYKIDPEKDLLIIYDDIDIDLNNFKTTGKSSGGHKGLESIIKMLGTENIKRVRIGINSDLKGKKPTQAFVLEKFTEEELKILEENIFPEALEYILKEI